MTKSVRIVDMRFEFTSNSLDQISSDGAVLFAFKDKTEEYGFRIIGREDIDEEFGGKLEKICKIDGFYATKGEVVTVVSQEDTLFERVFVLGLGKKSEFNLNILRRAIGKLTKSHKKNIDTLSIAIPEELKEELGLDNLAFVMGEGLMLGNYEFIKYKGKRREREVDLVILSEREREDRRIIERVIKQAEIYSNATILARDLVNEPTMVITPSFLADLAIDIAKKNPECVTCKIYNTSKIEDMGMGAFLAVARATVKDIPPKFIHLEYKPKKKKVMRKKVALVGKGITFDAGGVNVKSGIGMQDEKKDMAGAATVLGVFSVIADIKPDFPVMGLIAATPNLISSLSMLPGDVVRAMSGKTIEIRNTDAEGRVTLADSLTYAKKNGATEIIDLATLTGASAIGLGKEICALFSNDKDLTESLEAAAYDSGEKIWEMPLEKEYKKFNRSEVADISNSPKVKYGGAISAALFLEEFVGKTTWAHMDMAGAAFAEKAGDICPKGGTGFGVRLLLNYLTDLSDNS